MIPQKYLPIFEPRKLSPPGGYHSPKCIAAGLSSVFIENQLSGYKILPVQVSAQATMYRIIDYKVPVYYVKEDMIRAVAATKLPSGIQIKDIKLPMPGFVLGIPPKFLLEYLNTDTCYFFCGALKEGENNSKLLPGGHIAVEHQAKVGWFWFSYENGRLSQFTSRYGLDDYVNEAIGKYEYVDYTNGPAQQAQNEEQRNEKVSSLLLKLFLIMSARNGIIQQGKLLRSEKVKKGKKICELWEPNFIGKNYKIVKERIIGGHHASPKMHWRIGHMSWTVTGKRQDFISISDLPTTLEGEIDWRGMAPTIKEKFLKSHNRIWIEPCLVGEKEESV